MIYFLRLLAIYGAAAALCMFAMGFCSGRVSAHDIYMDWKMPDNPGVSCCHDRDCRPVTATPIGNDAWLAHVDGRDVLVPPNKVMLRPSPDGRTHWCGQGSITYCFLPGEVRI